MDVVATLVSVLREGGLDAMASVDTDIAVDTDPLVIVEESVARPVASFSWRWAHQVNIDIHAVTAIDADPIAVLDNALDILWDWFQAGKPAGGVWASHLEITQIPSLVPTDRLTATHLRQARTEISLVARSLAV